MQFNQITTTVLMTPDAARAMLEKNTGNRPLRKSWVTTLSERMKGGEWQCTHEGIALGPNSEVLDGQHRLHAIVKAGVAILIRVTTGCDPSTFSVINSGIVRSIADLTRLNRRLASSCNFIARNVFAVNTPSPSHCLKIARAGVDDIHDALCAKAPSVRAYFSSATWQAAAVTLVLSGTPKEYVFKIYADLVHERFGELPEVAHSLIRQVNRGRVSATDSRDSFARGIKVMDPKNSAMKLARISEDETAAIIDWMADFYKARIAA